METPKKKPKSRDFRRSLRYLWPHRKLLAISVAAAFLVGVFFTSGLGTVLPIMQVLIYGDRLDTWVHRQIVEKRLGVRIADDAHELRLSKISDDASPARQAGLKGAEIIELPQSPDSPTRDVLAALANPSNGSTTVLIDRTQTRPLNLAPLPWHLSAAWRISQRLPSHPVAAIAWVLGFLVALALLGNAVRFIQEYFSESAAILAVRDIRLRLYDHALHMPMSYFGQRGTSDLTSRITQDAQGLQEGFKSMGHIVQDLIKAAMAFGLAIYASWQLTFFIIGFAPVMFILIKKFGKKIRRAARAALQNSSLMLGQIEGSLIGIRVVKAHTAERFERRRFRGIVNQLAREYKRIARIEAINTPTLELMTLIVVCGIVLYAAYLVLVTQSLKPGSFFLVMACLMGIGESLRKVSKINNVIQKSNAAAARLFELMDDFYPERPRHIFAATRNPQLATRNLPPISREIKFDNLIFTYPGASIPALRDVSLTVAKGASVAVVGRNGSGKSTLLSLLPRFYEPQQGRILIDGIDIRHATLTSLRRQIGIVTQDSILFPGTIAENIAYARPDARREDIIAAAKQAFAHDFITQKPHGYDTPIGEHGSQLSGGQKQRLCIARAIFRKTPILILDEATSQVDAESEHLIQQAIDQLMHDRTTFVIAHRFSTIKSADLIVVMDEGQIVGAGSHDHLLRSCPTYQQLYERQLINA